MTPSEENTVYWIVGLCLAASLTYCAYVAHNVWTSKTIQPLQCIDRLVYMYDAKNQIWMGTGQVCVSTTKPIKRQPAAVRI